jgi:anti-sigma regulatory factor (Ser/Thr protein kinase)
MTGHRASERIDPATAGGRHDGPAAPASARQAHGPGRAGQPAASRMLVPQPESVKDARDFTRVTLSRWGMTAVCDDAQLVVSELVTNALRHAAPGSDGDAPAIGLRLMARAPYLVCMVTDPSREMPLRRDPGPLDTTGRGLHVIESCSRRWGWRLVDEGKVVWALLPGG